MRVFKLAPNLRPESATFKSNPHMSRQKVVRMERLKQRIPKRHSQEFHPIARKMRETHFFPSGQMDRLSSSSPTIFEGGKQGLTLVTKAEAGKLLMVSTACLPS